MTDTAEPPADEGHDAHAAYIRTTLHEAHEQLADARRNVHQALTTLAQLYRGQCGSDCCPLQWAPYTAAKQLLEEADRDLTAALALTGGRP